MSVQKPVKTSLPALPASAAPDMRMYLERVREELSRIQAGSSTTTVISSGGSSSGTGGGGGGGGSGGGGGGVDPTTLPCGDPVTPTAPTNFQVTAGFNFFMVEWDYPSYCGHSHTEVYGTKDDGAQGTEVLLGTTGGTIFSLAEPNTGVRRCFWAKHVNLVGVKGPYNGTEGTCDTTALDPGQLIAALTNQITATELYQDLGEQIELLPQFDAAITDLNSAVGQLAEGVTDISVTTEDQCLINGVNDPSKTTEEACTGAGGLWVAGSTSTLKGVKESTDASLAAIVQLNTVTASSTSANAKSTAGLVAQVDLAEAQCLIGGVNNPAYTSPEACAAASGTWVPAETVTGYVIDQGEAWANGEGALGQRINGVEAQIGDARPNLCPNSGFEQGTEGLYGLPTGFTVSDGAGWGRYIYGLNPGNTAFWLWPAFAVTAGQTYSATLDASLILASGTNCTSTCRLRFYASAADGATAIAGGQFETTVGGPHDFSDSPARREEYTVTGVAPAGATHARVGIQYAGYPTVAGFGVRRVQAVQGAPPIPAYNSQASGNQTAARVINVETARIGYCTKAGVTTADGTKSACEANGGTWATGMPWATAVKQVSVTANNGQTATVQQEFEAIYGTNGLRAQYAVKIDNAGVVSGFGLSSEPVDDGGSRSYFIVRADHFGITGPTYNQATAPTTNLYNGMAWRDTDDGITRYCVLGGSPGEVYWVADRQYASVPFQVVTSLTYDADGNVIPPGVYITDAYIKNATITTAKIKNAAITDAKILNLSANKLTAGSIAVGQCIGSTGFQSGVQGWQICGNGNAEFNNQTVRGTIYGGAATGFDQGAPGLFSGVAVDGYYKFRVGNTSGSANPARVAWNSATGTLAVVGNITATGGTITGVLNIVPAGTTTTDVVELDGPNQRLRVSQSGATRVIVGRANNGEYGLFVRDNNGIVAMSSYGTLGLNETDKDGDPIYQTSDFYIDSAYIKNLKTGSINDRSITKVLYDNGTWGSGTLTTNAVEVAMVGYTVDGLPNGELAEFIVVGTMTVYPASGSTAGHVFIGGLRADGQSLGVGSAVFSINTAQCLSFTGKVSLGNGYHYFQTVAYTQSGSHVCTLEGQVVVMAGKR